MSWSYISQAIASGANPAITSPTTQIGDLMVIVAASNNVSSYSALSGWNNLLLNGGPAGLKHSIWWRLAASTNEGVITLTNSSTACRAVMLIYRGLLTNPFDTNATDNTTAAITNTLFAATNNELVISSFVNGNTTTWTGAPSGTTEQYTINGDNISKPAIKICDENVVNGTTSARTATPSAGGGAFAFSFKTENPVGGGLFFGSNF